jgi:hypothetical protein
MFHIFWFKNLVMTFILTYFSLKFRKIGVNQTFFNKNFWVRGLDDIYHASLVTQIPYITSSGPRWHLPCKFSDTNTIYHEFETQMTQRSKFMNPNIKNPEFGIQMIPLCKLRDQY